MTGDAAEGNASAILRAVGSLLMALSGSEDKALQRMARAVAAEAPEPADLPRAAVPFASVFPPVPRREEPAPTFRPPVRSEGPRVDNRSTVPDVTDPDADVELILSDARKHAQRILDESMERARALVESRSASPASEQAVRDVRSAVTDLATDVRDVQQRLDRIEALLRQERGGAAAAPARPATLPGTPAASTPTAAPTPRPRQAPASAAFAPPAVPPLVHYEPEPGYAPTPAQEVEPEAEPEPLAPPASATPPAPATPPPASGTRPPAAPGPQAPPRTPSFSVVPQRSGWPAVESTGAPESAPGEGAPPRSAMPPVRPSPPAADLEPDLGDEPDLDDTENDEAPIATFLPGEGTLVLRVMPVSGFQGLMRVQDALARLPFVRHAAVEAYSQGEARLRIELIEATDSDEIAAGLSERLQEPAHVRSASEADRELLIALR